MSETNANELVLLKKVNLIENKKLIIWLNIASIPLFILLLFLFQLVLVLADIPVVAEFGILSILLLVVSLFVLLIIHELIHGLFFRVFNPQGQVKFGFKNGMAYATSPHSFYTKGQFAIIGLAPFILITMSLLLLYVGSVISGATFIFLGALHGSGCIGDFYWAYLLAKSPKDSLVEDTEVGISFYSKG